MLKLVRTFLAALALPVGLLLTLPVVLLGLPFWIVSALAGRVRKLRARFRPEVFPWERLVEFDPELGWKPVAGLDVHVLGSGTFHIVTDAEGWRGKHRLEEAEIAVFGDSFAFGHGADEATFFANLERGARIKAMGADGYNTVQQLLWMEKLADRLRGKIVAWFIYYGNDLYDNLQPSMGRYRTPFVRRVDGGEGWEIVTDHIQEEPWPFPHDGRYGERLAEICTPGRLSSRAFDAFRFLLRRGQAICRRVGAPLIVVGVPDIEQIDPAGRAALRDRSPDPDGFDADRPDVELRAICADLDVPFLALSEHLTVADHLFDDVHWSPQGHVRVATLLARLADRFRGDRLRSEPKVPEAAELVKARSPVT